jgi:cobalt-zinc-cadmium efflux system protein
MRAGDRGAVPRDDHDHDHDHDHDRDHGHGHDRTHHHGGSPAALRVALGAAIFVTVVEVAGGLFSHSLALLADSAHVLMDVVAIAIALVAGAQALRPATARRTYGFARFEILAALLNGGLLFATTIAIALEAVQRFIHPEKPEGAIMLIAAAIALTVNAGVGVLLARGAHDNLNLKAVLLHVVGDALGALAVIAAGLLILRFDIVWIDPALSLVVAAIILFGVVRVVREAADVLLQSAPRDAQPEAVARSLRKIEGVRSVHDVHVWALGSKNYVLTAHVLLDDKQISEATHILRSIENAVRARFDITHATVQFECETCAVDERIVCTQAPLRAG